MIPIEELRKTPEYWQERLSNAAYTDLCEPINGSMHVLGVAKEYAQHVIESRLPSEEEKQGFIQNMYYKIEADMAAESAIEWVISKLKD